MAKRNTAPAKQNSPSSSNQISGQATGTWQNSWLGAAALFVLAFVLYGNTLHHGYTLDDAIVLKNNSFTQQGLHGLNEIFTEDAFTGYFGKRKDLVQGGRYRPLSIAQFALEVEFFGVEEQDGKTTFIGTTGSLWNWSHFFNVFYYALTGVVLFFFLGRLLQEDRIRPWYLRFSFLVTLLFMVHPIHTEVVANIKGRDEIMALLLGLGGLHACLLYIDRKDMVQLALGAGLMFGAYLSKESALPLVLAGPVALLLFRKEQRKAAWTATGVLGGITVLYLAVRFIIMGLPHETQSNELLNDPFLEASTMERWATSLHTLDLYLLKLFAPVTLTHDYYPKQVPIIGMGDPIALLALAIHLGLAAYAVWGLIKGHLAAWGVLWYLATISIVSNIVFTIGTLMGERFVYIPSLGFIIAVLGAVHLLLEKRATWKPVFQGKAVPMAVGAVALLFAVRTIVRNPVWADNFTLFTTDVAHSPESAKARTSAGGALVEAAQAMAEGPERTKYLEEAIGHLQEAVRIHPRHGNGYLLLGNAYFYHNGQYAKALEMYEKSIRFSPGLIDGYTNAASAASKMGNKALSDSYLQQALSFQPDRVDIWFTRGINFEELNQPQQAMNMYQEVVKRDPKHWEAYGKMGMLQGKAFGNLDESIRLIRKAISLNNKESWLYENLGIALAMKGDPQGAIQVFNDGLAQLPNSAKLYMNLGITYSNLGDMQQAQQYYDRAFALDPNLRNR